LTRSYSAGLYQWHEAKFTVPVAAANSDIVVYITYSSGATPDKEGLVRVPPSFAQRMKYFVFAARDVTWVTNRKYPKGTAWNININTSLNADYTQTADLTGAQIAAQLEPIVEALTGIDSTIETTPTGTAIRITVAAGGLATVLATGTFSATTRFWNPDITLGFTGLVGKTLKNLSDGSSGLITDAYAQGITVAALTGGVENRFRNGDLIVVVDSSPRFTFRQIRWKERNAGDSITNPWPSILDNYVLDVFFHRGRLGLLSAGNVVMSEAGQAGNLFRTATTDLLDSDPIDVKPAASGTIKFHSAAEWGGLMTLWTDSAQYEIKGGDLLTPSNVQLPQISRYASSSLRPLTLGQRMFFSRGMERFTRMFEYRRRPNDEQPDALDVTRGVPRYLPGNPYLMTGDAAVGFLALITDDDRAAIFVHSFHYEQDQQLQSSWSRWELPPGSTVAGMDIVLGTLAMIVVRADGLYLETLELDELEAEPAPLLDRLIADTPTSGTYTLPYSIATNGSQGTLVCVRQDTGALVAVTRPAATTVSGTFSGVAVWFGVTYGFEYTFSPLYPRKGEGEAETRGRLQLSRGVLHYRGSQAFNVNTTPAGRPTRTKVFTAAAAEDGEFPFPIQSRNTTVTITVTNDTHLPSVLTGLDWEGQYVTRSRRL
jgi:hypothetical protein